MKKHLIIGGGLAGCALAYRLIKKGYHVRLIDNNLNKSSFIAAGMINPIVFRRVNKSWRVDDFLPSAIHFYNELQEETKVDFFSSIKIRRFFASEQEKKYWTQKQDNPSYVKYLAKPDEGHYPYSINKHKLGSGIVKNAYRVNAMSFMSAVHRMLESMGVLIYHDFEYDKLDKNDLSYNGESYETVVFSCGSDHRDNPFFNEVKIEQTKGQILTIHSKQITEKETWNHKGYILPVGAELFKVGATIERGLNDIRTTDDGKTELENVIKGIFSGAYEIKSQIAGVRPTVYDRRPVMGEHPNHKGIYIFNGLGTKGYLMAPLLSEEMADFIISGKELHQEVKLSRFYKKP